MTSLPADSPANQSASPEPEKRKTTLDGSGPNSSESFAWYDPDTSSWKTSQGSLLPEWATYSETWPRSGMTVNGKAYRLPLLVPLIYGGGSSSLLTIPHGLGGGGKTDLKREYLIWPTPLTRNRSSRKALVESDQWSGAPTLEQAVELRAGILPKEYLDESELRGSARTLWPTPTAQEAGGSDEWLETLETVDGEPLEPNQRWYDPETGKHVQQGLSRAVRLWPTPNTRDRGTDAPNRTGGPSLGVAARWSTPQARDWKDTGDPKKLARQGEEHQRTLGRDVGGALNPMWVEWLMGFPEGWTDLEA